MLQSNLILSPEGANREVARGCISAIRTSGLFVFNNSKKIMEKTCPVCGKEFQTYFTAQRSCSMRCHSNFRVRNPKPQKRPPVIYGDVVLIPLAGGGTAVVDPVDAKLVGEYSWRESSTTSGGRNTTYAQANIRSVGGTWSTISMHRLILGKDGDSLFCDHIDGNGLNNRRSNLRVATSRQNNCNRKASKHSSRYNGVTWNKRDEVWNARIRSHNKRFHLGSFHDEDDAGRAYNEAAKKYHGEFAKLNIIKSLVTLEGEE